MKYFDFLEGEEEKLLDELYEDPISKSLVELENSIEDSIIKPDSFKPPTLYQPDSLVFGGYESSLKNDYNLGGEERSGKYDVPIPPLRMSGGSRKPFRKNLFPSFSPRRNFPATNFIKAGAENCPLRNDEPVTLEECSECEHFLADFIHSHCKIKEGEYLDNLEQSEEE